MSFVKCFDTVSMVTEEASRQFGRTWRVNEDKEQLLKQNCDTIDALSEEFNGVSYEVDINDISMDITVSLVCGEVIVESSAHRLYSLLQHAKRFSVNKAEDGSNIQMNFVFPGIWEKAY